MVLRVTYTSTLLNEPGSMIETEMPWCFVSARNDSIIASTANFDMLQDTYAVRAVQYPRYYHFHIRIDAISGGGDDTGNRSDRYDASF